ncbi:MAG: hypothetical protein RLZZ600_1120 [Actinomycetota bacterium]
MRTKGIVSTALAVVIAVGMVACAPTSDAKIVTPGAPGGGEATAAPAIPQVTPADVEFAHAMLEHHKQGVELAALALKSVTDVQVRAVAQRIVEAQTAEQKMLETWVSSLSPEQQSTHQHTMNGMLSTTDMANYATLSGVAARSEFLRLMIQHHQGAIDMADARLKVTGSGTITQLARSIAIEQSAEIDRMKDLQK